MKARWVLQKQRPQFSGLSQGLNTATKCIYVFLCCRLPLVFRAFSPNFHEMRELLPQFYRKVEVGGCLVDPSFGHRLGWWPIKSKIDFNCVENLRVIFEFIEPFPFSRGIKGTKPALRRRTRIRITGSPD